MLRCGVTPSRYLGVILIIFEIFSVVLTVIKSKEYLTKILLVGAGLILVTMNVPKINIIDVSNESQYRRLVAIYKKDTEYEKLSDEDKKTVKGAYSYLKRTDEGKKYIPDYVKIDDYSVDYYSRTYETDKKYNEINYNSLVNEISVDGYKRLILVHFSDYLYSEEKKINEIELDFFDEDNYRFYIKKDHTERIRTFIEDSMNVGDIKEESIELDEYNLFVISEFNVRYDKEKKEIENVSLKGYMLMR